MSQTQVRTTATNPAVYLHCAALHCTSHVLPRLFMSLIAPHLHCTFIHCATLNSTMNSLTLHVSSRHALYTSLHVRARVQKTKYSHVDHTQALSSALSQQR
jgi:hypothetical protein